MLQRIRNRFSVEEGATAVEYGIMVALIAAVIIAAVIIIGNNTRSAFECVGNTLETGVAAEQCGPSDGGT